MLVTLNMANSCSVLVCKKTSILSSRDIASVWSLRPGLEAPVYKESPPTTSSSYCLQREGPSQLTTFQSSCDKTCVAWKINLLPPHLVFFRFHVPEPLCAVWFHLLCKGPFVRTPAGSHVPLRILPLRPGTARGSNAGCAGELSASPVDQHLCATCWAKPRLLAVSEACLELPKCKD